MACNDGLGFALLLCRDALAKILANGSAAFFESVRLLEQDRTKGFRFVHLKRQIHY